MGIDNREMAEFANNLWENFIKFRHKEANLDTVSFYKAEITAKPGNGKFSIKRPFDTESKDVEYAAYMADAPIGAKVLVLKFGEGNNLANHFIVDNAARTMLASAIQTGSSIAFPISIANGGTGATSLAGAKTNLEVPTASNDTPNMDGTASAGSLPTFSRADHTHPADTAKADKSATVTNVSYNSSTKKIRKTINGTTTDVTPVVTSFNGDSGAVAYTAPVASVNSKTGDVSLSADDVGALPDTTVIPNITMNGVPTSSPSFYAPIEAGTNGYFLKSNGSGAPTWSQPPSPSGGSSVSFTQNLTVGAEAGTITIDNVDTKVYVPNVAYATSSTQGTTALTATVSDSQPFALTTGAIVAVKFTYAKPYQAANIPFTLAVNSTTAKQVYCNGEPLLAANKVYAWSAGDVVMFLYDGTYWQLLGKTPSATTETIGVVQLSSSTNTYSNAFAATSAAVKAAYDLANSKSLVTLNGTETTTPSFYAPTSAGYSGNVLMSNGAGNAPYWGYIPQDTFRVRITFDDGDVSVDQSFSNILAAARDSSALVYGFVTGYGTVYNLYSYDTANGIITFLNVDKDWNSNRVAMNYVYVYDDDTAGSDIILSDAVPSASTTLPIVDGTAAIGSSSNYAKADHVHPKITQTISISNNVITLSGSDGSSSTATLPVYNGSMSPVGG